MSTLRDQIATQLNEPIQFEKSISRPATAIILWRFDEKAYQRFQHTCVSAHYSSPSLKFQMEKDSGKNCGEVDSGGIGGRITDSGSRWKFRREARVCKTFQEMTLLESGLSATAISVSNPSLKAINDGLATEMGSRKNPRR
ncbi:hypothetical protein LXL04_006152 [Taraxacum kok-saghyz]